MPSGMALPTFEEWLAHWFAPKIGAWRWSHLPPRKVTAYMTGLLERPSVLIERFPPRQINTGLWAVCGVETGYFHDVRSPRVPAADAQRCVRAISVLYRDLFARVCTDHYGHLDEGPERPSPVNSACYMLWDMDQLEGAAMFPGGEHLVDPIFEVLTSALALDSIACRESALHGLGHLATYHPKRVEGIIDAFLRAHRRLPKPLAHYAQMARSGHVQ
jgi:hypothetical protein